MGPSENRMNMMERLDDYWNEVVAGGSPDPAGADPELVEVIQLLQMPELAEAPDPALGPRLWQGLYESASTPAGRETLGYPEALADRASIPGDGQLAGAPEDGRLYGPSRPLPIVDLPPLPPRQAPAPRPAEKRKAQHPLWRLAVVTSWGAAAAVLLVSFGMLLLAAWALGRPLLEGRAGQSVAADPRQALVELHFSTAEGRVMQAGISLGNGHIVTPVTWSDGPAFTKVEANWGRYVYAEAKIVKVDREHGLALLSTIGAMPPALGPAGTAEQGDLVRLVGREGPATLPPAQEPPDVTSVLSVREADAKLLATGVALPDPRVLQAPAGPQAGPYMQVQGETWPGLVGGLVLDADGRPAGLVTLATTLTSGAPGTAYALPLAEVEKWASLAETEPTPTPTPAPVTAELDSTTLKVRLSYPAAWQPVEGYEGRYGGPDGFVQPGALEDQGWTLEEVCQLLIHEDQAFGASPTTEWIQVDGGQACLILPSDDQVPITAPVGNAVVVVRYAEPVTINGFHHQYFTLHADQEHIRQIAASVRFADAAPTGTPVAADARVAQVGQQDMTLADFEASKAAVTADLAYMRDEIAKGSMFTADLEARVQLIEEAGIENVALAGLISKTALYQQAIDAGYDATDEEVASAVAAQRKLEADPTLTGLEDYIQTVGEERYWSELMPLWQRRQIATSKFYTSVVKHIDPTDQARVWAEFRRETVGNTDVRVIDQNAVAPATVQGALDYLEKYWQLSPQTGD
ncbi:MAG: trypsin-like peptidase domain-containing protein [Chloroflexota bacterium]